MKVASKPPAKKKRYCAFSPLNSTVRPTPLLISQQTNYLQEEGTQDRGRHDEEDTGTEPRGCRLTRIRVTRGELVVDLDVPDEPYHSFDSIDQFRARSKVARHHLRGFVNP